jgi:hypothetical protein
MNNVVKTGLLTFVFTITVITIGLLFGGGISTVSMVVVDDVLAAEKDKQVGMNTDEEISPISSLKNSTEKCSPLDPRGC